MISVKRLMLDVLKPHSPNALDFAKHIVEQGPDYHVILTVVAVDEKTESVQVEVDGSDIQFDKIVEAISSLGGSVHSIDEVEVIGNGEKPE